MIYLDDTPMGKVLGHLVKDKEIVTEIPAKTELKSFLGSNYADMAIVVGYFRPKLATGKEYCPPFKYYPTYVQKDIQGEYKEGFTNWYYVYLMLLQAGLLIPNASQYLSLFMNYNTSVWDKDINAQCLAAQDAHIVDTYVSLVGLDNLRDNVDVLSRIKELIYSDSTGIGFVLQNLLAYQADYRATAIRKANSALCKDTIVSVIQADTMMNLCGLELQAKYHNEGKQSITFVQNGGFCLAFADDDSKQILDALAIDDLANTNNIFSFYMRGLEDRRLVMAISEEMG